MKCLGIEGTAHTFGAAIMDNKKILSDIRDSYKTKKGGIIPNDAANHHRKVADKVIKQALKQAKLTIKDINLISFSQSPGLAPCLIATRDKAVEIAKKNKIPIIGINHCISHLTSGLLFTKATNPVFIFVSGANTQIISLEGNKFRIFGESLDIGLGNALDKFGREINLGFPAGPKMESLAKKGKYIPLTYTVKGMDLAFSGIITEAITKFKKGEKKQDLCYSLQETLFAMLTEVSERALAHTQKNELVLIGGVAANKRLCNMLKIMCKERKAKFFNVPLKYAGDNAVMIAYQGILEYKSGKEDNYNIDIIPNLRTDEVMVTWK